MTVSLFKAFITGMTDYIVKHNDNYSLIETNLNYLLTAVIGQSGNGGTTGVLAEIFDRAGIIGKDSYDFTEGLLSGPNYNLTISAGAYWSGGTSKYLSALASTTISLLAFTTGTLYIYVNAAGYPAISDTAQPDTVWQFSWNSGSHVVSSKALYSGISILFDGDDYANQLVSISKGRSYLSVSDRLEDMESGGGSAQYAEMTALHDGLDFYYDTGKVRNDSVIHVTAAGYVTLADNDTCYIEVDPDTGIVSTNVVGYTTERIALYKVVTASGEIDSVVDDRTWALAGTGGGGGGHTQNTDVGTSLTTFILNYGTLGAPIDDCALEVERGDGANVSIRWSEEDLKWQYSNDGVNFYNIGDVSIALGAQELTKFVSIDEPQEVWTETARSTSMDWEDLDLSGEITALQGCSAVVLRVFFWDDAPGVNVNVMFRKKNAPAVPLFANSAWNGENDPSTIIVGVDEYLVSQFFVNASGTGTAGMRVFLVGYFEKVVGVGTQDREFIPAEIVVAASENTTANKAFFLNRGLVHYLKIEEIGGLVTEDYSIEIFSKDTFLDEDLLYKATGIDPAIDYEDWLPWFYRDDDVTNELHVKITNADTGQIGTYIVTIKAEQFA
jgi:hypothetical protein